MWKIDGWNQGKFGALWASIRQWNGGKGVIVFKLEFWQILCTENP